MSSPDATIECDNYIGDGQDVSLNYGTSFVFNPGWVVTKRPELQADLFAIAGGVLLADRSFRRHRRLGAWTRQFRLRLKVREPARWQKASGALVQALGFLSGDNWAFTFEGSTKRLHSPIGGTAKATEVSDGVTEPGPVVLFSGGLDSFCGACSLLHAGKQQTQPLFVSSYTKDLKRVTGLLRGISEDAKGRGYRHWPIFFKPVGLKLREPSRRTRSFFFLFQAVAACLEREVGDVRLYENGIVALNLPLRADLLGSQSTCHAHPYFLERINRVLEAAIPDSQIRVMNPFQNQTKGEILSYVGPSAARTAETVSCWAYPDGTTQMRTPRKKHVTHCGYCHPCLVRRVSLAGAGIEDPPQLYARDVCAAAWRKARAGAPGPWAVARFLDAFAQRMSGVTWEGFYRTYAAKMPHLRTRLAEADVQQIRALHQRFATEVGNVLGKKH